MTVYRYLLGLLCVLLLIVAGGSPLGAQIKNRRLIKEYAKKEISSNVITADPAVSSVMDVGRWAVYLKKEHGRKSLIRLSVLAKEGDAWRLEIVETYPREKFIINVLATSLSGPYDKMELISGSFESRKQDPNDLGRYFKIYFKPWYMGMKAKSSGLDMVTAAGRFNGVQYYTDYRGTDMTFDSKDELLEISEVANEVAYIFHPALPLNGLLGWKTKNEEVCLLEFGFQDAQSEQHSGETGK